MTYFRLKNRKKYAHNYGKTKLVQKVAKLAKTVFQNRPESKYSDTVSTGQQFNNTPTVNYVFDPYSLITQGNTDLTRNGDCIFVKNIQFRGTFYNGLITPMVVRFVMFNVKHAPEGLLTTTNIGNLLQESAYSTTINGVNAPIDHDNRSNFTKVYDRKFIINPIAVTATAAKDFKLTLKINKEVQFLGAGVVASKNWLVGFWLSEGVASSSNIISYVARTTYTDV